VVHVLTVLEHTAAGTTPTSIQTRGVSYFQEEPMSEIEELRKRVEALEAAVKWLGNPTFGSTAYVAAPATCGTGTVKLVPDPFRSNVWITVSDK
jgi:hypothetical protein